MHTDTHIPMRRIDLNANPDIAGLTEVLRAVSSVTEPTELLASFGGWVARRFRRDYFISVSRRGLDGGRYKLTRVLPGNPEAPGYTMPPVHNPWRDWKNLPAHAGGIIGEVIKHETPQMLTDIDLASDPVLGPIMGEDAASMRWMAAMPTYDRGEAINWAMSFSADAEWLGLDTFADGLLDINMMGTATRNLVALGQVARLHQQLDQQLDQLAVVQRALLPERPPDIRGYSIATSYETSAQAGGDYYDFLPMRDGSIGLLIADVAGHGPAAAAVMAMLRAILHAYAGDPSDPARIMDYANKRMFDAGLPGSFTTAFLGVLDPTTHTLRHARCGHNPPRLRRASGAVETIDEPGTIPLGIDPYASIEQGELTIQPGDALVLYTDGITESFGGSPQTQREMFGTDRLDHALAHCTGKPGCAIDSILAALRIHTDSCERDDDQTLVVLRRLSKDDHA